MASSQFGRVSRRTNPSPSVCMSKAKEAGIPVQAHGVLGSVSFSASAYQSGGGAPQTLTIACSGTEGSGVLAGAASATNGRVWEIDVEINSTAGTVNVYVRRTYGGFVETEWGAEELGWNKEWPIWYGGLKLLSTTDPTPLVVMAAVA